MVADSPGYAQLKWTAEQGGRGQGAGGGGRGEEAPQKKTLGGSAPHILVPKVSLVQHKIDIQSRDLCINRFIRIVLGGV